MDKETWQQVEQLFYQALDKAEQEREDFLRQQCKADPALLATVLSLLEHEGQTLHIEQLVATEANVLLSLHQDLSGTVLGRYRLVRQIGKGGMGAVYLAERADRQFEKQVAVKLIATPLIDTTQLHAFKRERQILADLEHPAICRLLDGGTTDDGIPYLVMEHVKGVALDEYCDAASLSVTTRLQLFVKIVQAVAFAHQNMVVHCDLKPSNIIINQSGEPKLLDFGVAHLLTRSQSGLNQENRRHLSLQYASPEQKNAETITTLSDIYSLGVILQKLIGHAVTEEVRYIILRARHDSPAQRYHSVTALSDDIKRYLGCRPVQAYPGSRWYRYKLFVRRNIVSCTLALVFAICVIGFSAMLWQQEIQVRLERDQARLQRDKAQAISQFISDMLTSVDPHVAKGHTITVLQVLQHSSATLMQPQEHALTRQPEVEAAIRHIIGRTYLALGDLNSAQQHLEQAQQLVLGHKLTHTALNFDIIKNLADVYQDQYKTQQVLTMRYDALALAEQLYGIQHVITIGAMSDLASAYHMAGELVKAEQMWQRLYKLRLQLLGASHPDVIQSLANLGIIHHWLGNYDIAEQYYKQCLDAAVLVHGLSHPRSLSCLSTLGSVYEATGRYTEAEAVIRQHIEISTQVLGPKHPDTMRSVHNLADTLRGLGQLDEAERLFNQALADRKQVLGDNNIETLQSQMKLARLLMQRKRHVEALPMFQDVYKRQQEQLGVSHQATLMAGQLLADAYLLQQKYPQALQLYQHILTQRSEALGAHPDSIDTLAGIAMAYYYLDRQDMAEQALSQAKQLAEAYPQHNISQLQQANTKVEIKSL